MRLILINFISWFFSSFILYKFFGFEIAIIIISLLLFFFYLINIYWVNKLSNWLKNRKIKDLPQGYGIWTKIFTQLYKTYRQEEKSKKELNLTLEQFIAAAEAMLDGVIAINKQKEILWCNKPAQEMMNINLKKNYKTPINYIFRNTQFTNYLERNNYDETIKISNLEKKQTIEIKITPFRSNMRLITCRDISQTIFNENIRKEFVSNFSHELKTPLTVIIGFLETLESNNKKIDKNTKKIFSLMTNQAICMKKLIDDLLLLSNVENNHLQNREEKIDINKLLKKIKKETTLIDNEKHILQFSIDTEINLKGSLIEVESAFMNLITNAIRYSEKGKIIMINWKLINGDPIFEVIDQGIGIQKKYLARITERFYRVDEDRSRDTGGTGLGLSIVKNIISQHQGKIEIISEPNKGSTFRLIFPKERLA